jgi:NAD(P)-dependent dehydrogenase (short-subunit alcohol dehydrogenase family)
MALARERGQILQVADDHHAAARLDRNYLDHRSAFVMSRLLLGAGVPDPGRLARTSAARSVFSIDRAGAVRFNRRIGEEPMIASSRRVAIVTGAGRGIGRAIALKLAGSFDLAITDIDPEQGAAVGEELQRQGGQALFEQSDLADLATHQPTLERIIRRFGRIDCLVNNAGIASPVRGDLLELTPENYDRVLAVNLRGTLFFTQAVARRMLAQTPDGARSIITVSSVNAAMAAVERGDYAISKTGLAMLTKLFALRLAEVGIGVFEVRPGIIRTDMTAKVSARYDQVIAQGGVPMRRWGESDDVAGAVAALAGDAFTFATGSVIEVAGGLAIPRL